MDELRVSGTEISRDTLLVWAGYGGGCGSHLFRLCYDAIPSKGPRVRVRLTDWTNNYCEMGMARRFVFDLRPLKQEYLPSQTCGRMNFS